MFCFEDFVVELRVIQYFLVSLIHFNMTQKWQKNDKNQNMPTTMTKKWQTNDKKWQKSKHANKNDKKMTKIKTCQQKWQKKWQKMTKIKTCQQKWQKMTKIKHAKKNDKQMTHIKTCQQKWQKNDKKNDRSYDKQMPTTMTKKWQLNDITWAPTPRTWHMWMTTKWQNNYFNDSNLSRPKILIKVYVTKYIFKNTLGRSPSQ